MKINKGAFNMYPTSNHHWYLIGNWFLSADNEIFEITVEEQWFTDIEKGKVTIKSFNIEKVNSTRTDLIKQDVKRLGMKIIDEVFRRSNDMLIQHENKYYINDSWIDIKEFKEKLSELIVKKYQNKMKYQKNKISKK